MIKLTTENFEQMVLLAKKPVLIDFAASWCSACRRLDPVLEELSHECREDYTLCQVDVDDQQELAMRFAVMSIPTLILMDGGKEKKRLIGVHSKEEILGMIPSTDFE